jgi:acetylornithine deacetylase
VADEEYESWGAKHFVENYEADAAIVTEPTDLNICLAHRGFGVYKIVTQGKVAHGGNHQLGIDANMKMGLLLAELNEYAKRLEEQKTHPLCGEASAHVPLIEGGDSLFIYSDECIIHLERRTLPDETKESVMSELNDIFKKLEDEDSDFKASIECKIWRDPYEISPVKLIVEKLNAASEKVLGQSPDSIGHTWWEDSAIFGKAGMETVVMGPKGGGIHEEVEWVEIDSVTALARILYQTAVDYCNT